MRGILLCILLFLALPLSATTWFVRTDGGTRFSVNVPSGQCDGKHDASYASTGGTGTNQPCAFNDVRYLWSDNSSAPMAWAIAGGDWIVVRGCTALGSQLNPDNPHCRIGYDNNTNGNPPNNWCGSGVPNTNCFPPPVPNGPVVASITAVSISGGIATITAANTLTAATVVMLGGLSGGAALPGGVTVGQDMNAKPYIVLASGLSSTQFEVLATEPNGNWTDTGSVAEPTRFISGCTYDNTPGPCHTGNVRNNANLTQLFAGFGLQFAFNVRGSQWVDIEGLELTIHNKVMSGTAFSPSGTYTSGQTIFDGTNTESVAVAGTAGTTPTWNTTIGGTTTTGGVTFKNLGPNCTRNGNPQYPIGCNTGIPYDDYGANGFYTTNTTGNIAWTDVWVHGFLSSGFYGAIGGAITMTRTESSYNMFAGWNFDESTVGPNGTGIPNNPASSINASYVTMDWNGSAQEYPMVDATPIFFTCSSATGGFCFGDAWSGQDSDLAFQVCDHCTIWNNMKDAYFGPHTAINHVVITNSSAGQNGGQTWKSNLGTSGTWLMQNTLTNVNCRWLVNTPPGVSPIYTSNINGADLCRADGTGMAVTPSTSGSMELDNNTFVFASRNVSIDLTCWGTGTAASVNSGTGQNDPGTGYQVGDLLYAGGTQAIVQVTSVGAGGAITGLSIINGGQLPGVTAAPDGFNYIWTNGSGTGAYVFFTSISPGNCNGGGANRIMRNNVFLGYTNPNNAGWNGQPIGMFCYSSCQGPTGSFGTSDDTMWTNRTKNYFYNFNAGTFACSYAGETCADPQLLNEPSQTWTSETMLDVFDPTLSNNSFYPATGSPLIAAGTTGTGIPTTDFYGVAQTSPPTIGGVALPATVAAPVGLSGTVKLNGKVIIQ